MFKLAVNIFFLMLLTAQLEAVTDIKNYIVSIETNFQEKTIKGTTRIIFDRVVDEKLVFPLYGLQVEKVKANGKSVDFTVTENQLQIKATLTWPG